MATIDDFGTLVDDDDADDGLDGLFDEVGQGAEKMVAGIRPMADQARQDAYQRADELVAAARSGGIRPYDDSMGAARRYAAHFARGQRDADAFGRTHVGSAALQARIDHERRAQDLERRKADQEAGIRRREIDTSIADTAMKNAGTLDQENARGMWGTADAAAGIAQEKLKTRGGIREARINAAGRLVEANIQAKTQADADAAAWERQKDNQNWQENQEFDRRQFEIQQAALGAAAPAGNGASTLPQERVRQDENGFLWRGPNALSTDEVVKLKNLPPLEPGRVDAMERDKTLRFLDSAEDIKKGLKSGKTSKKPKIYWYSNIDPFTNIDHGYWVVGLAKSFDRKSDDEKAHYIDGVKYNYELATQLEKYVLGL